MEGSGAEKQVRLLTKKATVPTLVLLSQALAIGTSGSRSSPYSGTIKCGFRSVQTMIGERPILSKTPSLDVSGHERRCRREQLRLVNRHGECKATWGRATEWSRADDYLTPSGYEIGSSNLENLLQDLRAVVGTTHNRRAQADPPQRVIRNLDVYNWLSSACRQSANRDTAGRGSIWRVGHGVARSVKDLRDLRLPLVSSTNSQKRLLQRMRHKTERISVAG
jgi:hypothetical protein